MVGLGLLSAGLLVAAYFVHFRARWAVARYQRQLIAAGEILDVRALCPPPVLPENNGADIFREAIGGLAYSKTGDPLDTNAPPAMHMVAPGKAMVGWAQPDIRVNGTNTWSEIAAALSGYRDALDVVSDAAEHPNFNFHLDYRQGFTLLIPHLAPLKRSVSLLSTETLLALHSGDTAAATTNVQTMLALVNATADERLAISQLVRIAMAAIAMNATWELLQSPKVSDEQLAAIQRGWAGLSFIEPAEKSLEMERNINLLMLQRMRASAAQFRQVFSMGGGGSSGTGSAFGIVGDQLLGGTAAEARRIEWSICDSYTDQLRMLRGYQILLESYRAVHAGEPFVPAVSRQDARLIALWPPAKKQDPDREYFPRGDDLSQFFSSSVVAVSHVVVRVLNAEVSRELTTTALAIKRYQLRHGRYPSELGALVPAFLPAIPRDPADGKPLRYRLHPDGSFLLYSIGEDGVDDGGDASPAVKTENINWVKGRDYVWPWPATAEEVAAYEKQKGAKRKH